MITGNVRLILSQFAHELLIGIHISTHRSFRWFKLRKLRHLCFTILFRFSKNAYCSKRKRGKRKSLKTRSVRSHARSNFSFYFGNFELFTCEMIVNTGRFDQRSISDIESLELHHSCERQGCRASVKYDPRDTASRPRDDFYRQREKKRMSVRNVNNISRTPYVFASGNEILACIIDKRCVHAEFWPSIRSRCDSEICT